MAIELLPLSARSTREVLDFYAREATPVTGVEPSDAPCTFTGMAAVDGGAIVGVVTGRELPAVDGSESYVFPPLVVAKTRRREGIGRALVEAMAAAPRTAPRAWAVVTPSKDDEVAPLFLRAVGFEVRDQAIVYERETALAWTPRLGRFTVRPYDGTDEACNAAIADLHQRAYRGRFGITALDAGMARAWCAGPACLLLEDAGRFAGFGFVTIMDALAGIASIAVARRYWGGEAADALMDAMVTLARDRGRSTITGGVHLANRASHALVARHGGWQEGARVPYLARRLGTTEGASSAHARCER